ncbi:MAG TPA: hypothetical protein VGF67_27215 [Ktedonobacteraceae bacterium]|jgi:hypothetical protein
MVHQQKESHTLIFASAVFDLSTLAALLDHDPVVTAYRSLSSPLD